MHSIEFNPAFHTFCPIIVLFLALGGVLFVFLVITDLNKKSNRELLKVILQEFILSLENIYNIPLHKKVEYKSVYDSK